jgi:hypothetical protein
VSLAGQNCFNPFETGDPLPRLFRGRCHVSHFLQFLQTIHKLFIVCVNCKNDFVP